MALVLFSKEKGLVASFNDPAVPGRASFKMDGWQGFDGFKSIITRVTIAAQGNYQFLHTLGGDVFIYVFGDRIGQITVSGLAFDSTCGDADGSIGMERVMSFYMANRVSERKTPMKLTIGVATTIKAYLVGMTGDVSDPKSKIWQYSMQLAMVPLPPKDDANAEDGGNEPAPDQFPEASAPIPPELGGEAGDGSVSTTMASGSDATYSAGDWAGLDAGGAPLSASGTVPVPAGDGFAEFGTGPATALTGGF
jgi:hypothetical protein